MRLINGLLVMTGMVASLGCTTEEADGEASGGTGGTAGGSAGSPATGGSAGTAGSAGSAGAANDPCMGVPTSGTCADTTTIRTCIVSADFDEPPEIVDIACDASEACNETANGATCEPTGECRTGETECLDSSTRRSCNDMGNWVEEPCGTDGCIEQPGLGAQCVVSAPTGGTGIEISGQLFYEFRRPNDPVTPNAYSTTTENEGAGDMFITVFDNDELIGTALTEAGLDPMKPKGEFTVELDRMPTTNTFVFFWPMLFDQDGDPFIALAKAQSDRASHLTSTEYWSWGFEVCPTAADCTDMVTDIGGLLIDDASGAGGAHIYDWLVFNFFRMTGMSGLAGGDPLSLVTYWQNGPRTPMAGETAGIRFNCGNCFIPGGGEVVFDDVENRKDTYRSAMNISGRGFNDYDSHWSRSTINHEVGHWVMSSFSVSPGEGGPHFVDAASLPGLSYSEAFATFVAQSNMSGGDPTSPNPVYFTVQEGTGFWINLESEEWTNGALEKPNPNGPVDQLVNENIVASMFWSFWAESNAQNAQGLGDGPVFSGLRTERLLNLNRGYFRTDFIDYLDGLSCDNLMTDAQIAAVVDPAGYPWRASDVQCN